MVDKVKTVRGVEVPTIGLGTWRLGGSGGRRAVVRALELGYRHIDTAEMYNNEREIGEAIAESSVAREDLFLVSKVWRSNLRREELRSACEQSLERLAVDWLDLYLIHWPSSAVPIEESIAAMDELVAAGLTRHIGVSNYSVDQMSAAQRASEHGLLTNQVEYHPYQDRSSLLAACVDQQILLTAYSPVAKGRVTRDATLRGIGRKYGKTPAQVALRWLIEQENVVAIPKSGSDAHMRENLDVFDFELSQEDRSAIDGAR